MSTCNIVCQSIGQRQQLLGGHQSFDAPLYQDLQSIGDFNHQLAQELAIRYAGRPLLTTEGTVIETGDAMARQFKQQAIIIIEQFLDSDDIKIVPLTSQLLHKAFELYKSHDDKIWGMTDCMSFVVMREENVIEALTSDQHFVQAGFTALLT